MKFHQMVSEGYDTIREMFHERMHVIDATKSIEDVLKATIECLLEIINAHD
mgnify:FL=1